MRFSIRTRLTLWYGALLALALSVFSIGVMRLQEGWGRAQFDSELASIAAALSGVMDEELGETGELLTAVAEAHEAMDVPDRATAILDLRGESMAANWHGLQHEARTLATDMVSRRFSSRSINAAMPGACSRGASRRRLATT